jgi:hypothetical protein
MSCGSCNKVEPYEPDKSGLQYLLVYGTTALEGRSGKSYPIKGSLITRPHTPRGGWSVHFYIFGQRTVVDGRNPREVFLKSKELLELNSFQYTDLEIWFNLNIQWLEKAVNKYQDIRLEEILSKAQPNY